MRMMSRLRPLVWVAAIVACCGLAVAQSAPVSSPPADAVARQLTTIIVIAAAGVAVVAILVAMATRPKPKSPD
ncbi:MAG: hypothetical protein KKI08_17350 [Armatimonadetes bacterium]|nr:hypothetical protein [Armatimonadota bacterium]